MELRLCRARHGRAARLGGLLLVLLLLGLTPADARKLNEGLLEEVNRRWSGARCRLLFDVPVKRSRDSEGWSKSRWIVPAQGRKVRKGNLGAVFRVSDRAALPGGTVRAGTYFVAEGWAFEKPKSQNGLILKLRFEDHPAGARISFHGSFGKDLDIDDLHDMEQWVRMDFFQVSAADEGLVEVAAPMTPAEKTAPLAPESATAEGVAAFGSSEAVQLQVLGASTEPLTVAPGQAVILALTYEVGGVPTGRTVDVLERRVILRDNEVLTTLEASVQRASGIHRSTQSLSVPAGLEPGVLELRVSVHAADVESAGRTLFEVEAP